MDNSVYKLKFTAGVHFGTGLLSDTSCTFPADVLFSALYIEALKLGQEKVFYDTVKSGELVFSDALPYVGNQYLIPKPMVYVESDRESDSAEKKKYKKLKYLPLEQLENFLAGNLDFDRIPDKYGRIQQQTMASVRNEGETKPFHVGTYYFEEDNGLYVIVSHKTEEQRTLLEELLEAVSFSGIGGKKNSGLGRFTFSRGKNTELLEQYLNRKSDRYMTLSSALPGNEELETAMEDASYLLTKRSGFVASDRYADEWRKKCDLYVFASGSCFRNRFAGDIFDVSMGGSHPVYRYAKPLFMGV